MYDKQIAVALAKEIGAKHPNLKNQIQDLFELTCEDIADGGDASHAWGLFMEDIKEFANSAK
jgi:hypothetical protein